jgi:hypothetical protein
MTGVGFLNKRVTLKLQLFPVYLLPLSASHFLIIYDTLGIYRTVLLTDLETITKRFVRLRIQQPKSFFRLKPELVKSL